MLIVFQKGDTEKSFQILSDHFLVVIVLTE